MPFGKYAGRKLCDLPTYYLEWFYAEAWPKGRLGAMLETLFVIRTEGLHDILEELKKRYGGLGWGIKEIQKIKQDCYRV